MLLLYFLLSNRTCEAAPEVCIGSGQGISFPKSISSIAKMLGMIC